jgi:hypothetical protein
VAEVTDPILVLKEVTPEVTVPVNTFTGAGLVTLDK